MIRTLARIALVLVGLVALASGISAAGAEEATAAATLNGQRISACKDDLRFHIVSVSGEARGQIADHGAQPDAVWVVLVADITNLGTRADTAQPLANVR